ncbi:hypothetical protein [uncultured Clostridium sp.]|uniref:hypothetical protein n=1 Tax=uncultured Clostridium sp. TaxID=59620 RepID=UPI0026340F11|nr:hypothetical protein [uncultured Clostridium sp.]
MSFNNIPKIKDKNIVDKAIFKVIDKYSFSIFIGILIIVSLLIRVPFKNYQSGDYTFFLKDWITYLNTHGGFRGIATVPSDYNVPYLYILAIISKFPQNALILIKSVSIIFDYALALSGVLLIGELFKADKSKKFIQAIIFILIIFLPEVILDGAAGAQCDSIYTFFCIMTIYFVLVKKYNLGFIMLGIAFAFKLQAIFILPVLIILYFTNRKYSILHFLWILAMDFLLYIPALLMGRPLSQIITVYLNQATEYKNLEIDTPNIYSLFYSGQNDMLKTAGILFTLAIFIMILFIVIHKGRELGSNDIINFSLLSSLLCVYFLPSMHERYIYLACIFSVIYGLINRKQKWKFIVPAIINFVAFISMLKFLWYYELVSMPMLAGLLAIAIGIVLIDFFGGLNRNIYKNIEKSSSS